MSYHDDPVDAIRFQTLAFLEEFDDYDARVVRPKRTYIRRRWATVVARYLNEFRELVPMSTLQKATCRQQHGYTQY